MKSVRATYAARDLGEIMALLLSKILLKKGENDINLMQHFDDVSNSNIEMFSLFFRGMLERNIYLPPSAYESCFISSQHDENKVRKAAKTAIEVLKDIKDEV